MDRPHGLARWAALFFVAVALAAVSMVPRGVVRTTAAVHEFGSLVTAVDADGTPRVDQRTSVDHELPGVRGVVSREEQEVGLVQTLIAGLGGPVEIHEIAAPPDTVESAAAAVVLPVRATPAGSRAPPTSS